jgi:hypothetical protein
LGETTTLDVQFQPEHEFVFDYLTSDIKTADCIFDLIDNSIDAATATNVSMVDNSDSRFFEGFKIDLSLSPNCVKVQDNCGGISKDAFVNRAFRIGLKSNHSYGIGHFGVGLKRAILKMGRHTRLLAMMGKMPCAWRFLVPTWLVLEVIQYPLQGLLQLARQLLTSLSLTLRLKQSVI